jgi:hypothetical protein
MTLRTLDNEERTFLDKQIEELQLLHLQNKNGAAYNYFWMQLSAKLKELITAYKMIPGTTKLYQYEQYLSNGGTMSLEEWEADGRFDKSMNIESVEHRKSIKNVSKNKQIIFYYVFNIDYLINFLAWL